MSDSLDQLKEELERIDKDIRNKSIAALVLGAVASIGIFAVVSLLSCKSTSTIERERITEPPMRASRGYVPYCTLDEEGTLIVGPKGYCDINPHYDYSNHNGKKKVTDHE